MIEIEKMRTEDNEFFVSLTQKDLASLGDSGKMIFPENRINKIKQSNAKIDVDQDPYIDDKGNKYYGVDFYKQCKVIEKKYLDEDGNLNVSPNPNKDCFDFIKVRPQLGQKKNSGTVWVDWEDYYTKKETEKKSICVHYSVGHAKGSIRTLFFETEKKKLTKNGTASEKKVMYRVSSNYVIDSNGRIYELFDDKYWSSHLGFGGDQLNKQTIPIDFASLGYLNEENRGKNFDKDDIYEMEFFGETYTLSDEYTKKKNFIKLTKEQIKSFRFLVRYLIKKHPALLTNNELLWHTGPFSMDDIKNEAKRLKEALAFKGVYTHASVRPFSKSDYPQDVMNLLKYNYENNKEDDSTLTAYIVRYIKIGSLVQFVKNVIEKMQDVYKQKNG
ncbi:N-acetylmuramoyl-L-alanine amidase [Fibrobacter sp.]|uniref:N-acetylmuramoyl-L-alanine amidase n=1 Tax=Fibrobacter sp. TaxID=35828 RepID=UPI00386713E9